MIRSLLKAGTSRNDESCNFRLIVFKTQWMNKLLFFVLACIGVLICSSCQSSSTKLPRSCPRGQPITSAKAFSSTEVIVLFACQLEENSAADLENYTIIDYSTTPPTTLAIEEAIVYDGEVDLVTAPQTALTTYTLQIDGVQDLDANILQGSANFVGVGQNKTADVTLQVDDRYNANLSSVGVLISVNPATGVFVHNSEFLALTDPDEIHVFENTIKVAVDPVRTIDTNDDRLGSQYMAYSVRAVDDENRPLSELVLFEVTTEEPQVVKIPLLSVPQPPQPEGMATITFKVDDRPAQALSSPSLRGSFDADGQFDANFPSIIELNDDNEDNIWEGTAKVRIDPNRMLDGTTNLTKPYSVYLVEGEIPYTARSADFVAPNEKAVSVNLLLGNNDKVPVTFRVDVSTAWLRPDGSQKGVYAGEALVLTGEFGVAEDAFGQNAADAFSGGENVVLQMVERKDLPGLWERTIFLPKNRPCSWKVVRCPKNKGCAQLNKMVVSSGRAFPTVMKNLVTELCDVGKTTGWSDPNCKGPRVIDPRHLEKVDTGVSGVLDYSGKNTLVFQGTGNGLKDQKDLENTPNATIMFKQEIPDLVVDVKDKSLLTPVYVIGAWRDVNLDGSPADIVASGQVIDLSKTDYDSGMAGGAPPNYDLPAGPKTQTIKMDGVLEKNAKLISGGTNEKLALYMMSSGNLLYLATSHAYDGYDRFLFISAEPPGALRPAPWAKEGQIAFGGKTLYMAAENDNGFCGWFELGVTGQDDKLLESSTDNERNVDLNIAKPLHGAGVLEGLINLSTLFGNQPSVLYISVAAYENNNQGELKSSVQTPPSKNGNSDIEENEILKIALPSFQVLP